MNPDLVMIQSLLIAVAYISGSISSAVIVCKLMRLPNPRNAGSGNPGATNVLRIGGKKAAAITLLGDILKGFLPVLLAQLLDMSLFIVSLTALAAFLGHLYPVFFGFKGGKGVATLIGVLLGIHWLLGIAAAATWLLVAMTLQISSLSALIMALLAPVYSWFFYYDMSLTGVLAAMSAVLFWRHRNNIHNILTGKESKIALLTIGMNARNSGE